MGSYQRLAMAERKLVKYQRYPRTADTNGNCRECMQNFMGWQFVILKEWSMTGSRHGMYKAYV